MIQFKAFTKISDNAIKIIKSDKRLTEAIATVCEVRTATVVRWLKDKDHHKLTMWPVVMLIRQETGLQIDTILEGEAKVREKKAVSSI